MWSDPRDAANIHEMHGVLADIASLVRDQERETFLVDISRPYALAMHFIRLGELANRISQTTRSKHPDIAWQKMANLRHLIAHEYRVIDHGELWTIATVHAARLSQTLPTPPPPPEIL